MSGGVNEHRCTEEETNIGTIGRLVGLYHQRWDDRAGDRRTFLPRKVKVVTQELTPWR